MHFQITNLTEERTNTTHQMLKKRKFPILISILLRDLRKGAYLEVLHVFFFKFRNDIE